MVWIFFLWFPWTNYEARRPWYCSLKVCSSHSRVISLPKCSHILTPAPPLRLSQLWHSPNPGLQDLAWSSFACSLTSPLSLILEHHVPTTSAFFPIHRNMSTSLLLPGFCKSAVPLLGTCACTYICTHVPSLWLTLPLEAVSRRAPEHLHSSVHWLCILGQTASPYPHL